MRIDEVKKQLEAFGVLGGYREFATSSATVELAAVAAGCEPGRIAKTLSFKTAEGPIVIVVMGVRIFLDRSLKAFDPVYPAAGAPNNAVCLSLADLERVTGGTWIDVCKQEAE